MAQKKIAVLGGGIGSITAVYKLTEDPNWQSLYDITVYQVGWRLGGKCASGRNAALGQRIEEHGLHLWFGFYDNAFNLIQRCYEENKRPPGTPLATWNEAFNGYDFISLEEETKDGWQHWPFTLESNNMQPGYGDAHPTKGEYIYKMLEWLKIIHENYHPQKTAAVQSNIEDHAQSKHMWHIRTLLQNWVREGEEAFNDAGGYILHGALNVASAANHGLLKQVLSKFIEWLEWIGKDLFDIDSELRRLFVLADITVTTITGMIEDDVINKGFNIINNYDYREWLQKHGAANITINSAVVQAVYGLVFGGKDQYTFEAGTALRGLLRMALTYKGHVYYRMMAGMGDVVLTPFYEVLSKRGVKFEFFSKISNIALTPDKKNIEAVEIDIQATLKPWYKTYNPLVDVNGLPCWPTVPNYDQLVEGDELQKQNVNLESYYSTWQPVAKKTLNWQTDFDQVILGISIGALPAVASELIQHNVQWQNMINTVIPIPTIAFQLWLKSSINQMQWPYTAKGLALLGSYQEPYDTWADMSDLINKEAWPEGYTPQNIAYFCGPTPQLFADEIMQNARTANFGNTAFPDKQYKVAYDNALEYLQTLTASIWPGIWQNRTTFDFDQLIDLANRPGQQRFDAQFFRANIDPTELYVMSFTNSSQYRLKTDQNGYDNLYITGDWIDNGFNAGCVEATVMSGLQTARAISGVHFDIPGENDS
jgi:uncharacterized protein with NAD-binding domain and iron-sulfur cluster